MTEIGNEVLIFSSNQRVIYPLLDPFFYSDVDPLVRVWYKGMAVFTDEKDITSNRRIEQCLISAPQYATQ
jgi:hypothetical protein